MGKRGNLKTMYQIADRWTHGFKEEMIRLTDDFSTEMLEPKGQWNNILKC